ncbi:HlyC/CorC family transporter [Virgibacillus sp. NKC19-16]|uniref:hemolysin family protein n=1 Tax=Virgibacillus salidurans TaxID=2831673 RepID=UPI001F448521|nr:hemolysin family protein [Virgibacillus sp. NKC19-16]UJL47118.1 HlyC/CorC family transporter [Virgibacillus sp. NKC19-16]
MASAIGVLIVLLLLNAFFAASEIAFVSLNENKVKRMADDGDKKAQKLYNLINEPSRFLATIQIGITLAGFLASAFAADFFAGPLAEALYNLGVPISQDVLETISVVAITIILSYFTLVFGELVPKQLALQKAELIANIATTPVTWLFKICLPIVKFLQFSTNNTVKLFGVDPDADNEEATEEDIRIMVEAGGEKGTIQKGEHVMIQNIFEFNDKDASDIITHRTDMSVLSIDATLDETIKLVNKEKYTRFPVYEGDIDNIIGILHAKDLLQLDHRDEGAFNLKEMIRKPYFVLETQHIDILFKDMQKNNMHIAIVLDEYGGTEGLITIEDVIEEIVGDIFSESDGANVSEEEIKKIDPATFSIVGTIHLHEVEDVLEIELPTETYDTLSGFLIDQLGYFPHAGEKATVNYENIVFEVEEVTEKRIEKVVATTKEEE